MNNLPGRNWAQSWPFVVLALLAIIFVLMLIFSRKAPVIASLEPAMAAPGESVIVTGDYFGRTEREGSLSLAGEIPPPSLIQSWTDQKIVFVVPEDASSGLVTVSNSQGSSTGVLFTNTQSIPTVLQAASTPGGPLVMAMVPSSPAGGQTVTVTGRGFGPGDPRAAVVVSAGKDGPSWELHPRDCVLWTEHAVSFRWPAGAGSGVSVRVTTKAGSTEPFPVEALSGLSFQDPRVVTVEVSVSVAVPSGASLVLWGPVPQAFSGTRWTLVNAQPAPLASLGALTFRWPSGLEGSRRAVYTLELTTWSRKGNPPVGVPSTGEPPKGDERPTGWWKPAAAALKTLTAKAGLEVADPWLRAQRLQAILSSLRLETTMGAVGGLSRPPGQILASGVLDSFEASSLVAALGNQVGIPVRMVSGLWLSPEGELRPRVWNEFWLAGAGWFPWDAVTGELGSLDNRHFAFGSEWAPPIRLESRGQILGPAAGFSLGESAGEIAGSPSEPIVRWEIKRLQK